MRLLSHVLFAALLCFALGASAALAAPKRGGNVEAAAAKVKQELVAEHGDKERRRIERGVDQIVQLWQPRDGDAAAFADFARENFIPEGRTLDDTFARFEYALEQMDGHLNEIGREWKHWSELDLGPNLPIDGVFAAYDPWAHVTDDMFDNKAAFVVLLNFPLTTLTERSANAETWSRRRWAEARLAGRFGKRVPADVNQAIAKAQADGEAYIAEYNIWMHHLVDEKGTRLFPSGLRLLSHWNLRDELKGDYADKATGLAKQKTIAKVMERIVTQTIPRAVINNPRLDWNPFTNDVKPSPASEIEESAPAATAPASSEREPDHRYAHLLNTYKAARKADPYSPLTPTLIARRFEENRELPEARVKQLLEDVLKSPLAPRVAKVIEQRLGRKLEPFDIWYNGFVAQGKYPEAELDAIVRKKYPNAAAYQADIPRLLVDLGFSAERAKYLAAGITVDPARGSGHAMPALRRGTPTRLRTRVEKDGMNYKGYNIAVHEMGHNVEQVFSLNDIDHTLLAGVPNNAFTEALAFVFQRRDLELLGLSRPDAESERLRALNEFWQTYEIAGPAMIDIEVWHWMYDHPKATPAQLREATVAISKDVWNRYYAPVFGVRDVPLIGIYSHMVSLMMYLPDYPIGHMIAFQIEEQIERAKGEGKTLGEEFERMAKFGAVTPDHWMKNATGKPVSADALLAATEKALNELGTR